MKKICFILSLFLIFSCQYKNKEAIKETATILKKNKSYFDNRNWTNSTTILSEPLPEPFNAKKADSGTIPVYSDTTMQDNIFPCMEDLGILDYSGIDNSLLIFLDDICEKLKEQKIDPKLCVKEKPFLPHLINYRLKSINKINAIFFSRPEAKANKKMETKLKCKLNTEIALFELTTIFIENKWLINSLDLIEVKNE